MIKGHLYKENKKVHFTIPDNWSEVTLSQLEKISQELDGLELFSVLSGLDLELIKQCRREEVLFIVNQLESLFNYDELINQSEQLDIITLNNKEYKITTDLMSMPSGQWWDVTKIEQMYKDKPMEAVRHVLSILFVEVGKHYDYSDVKEKYEALAELDVLTAFKVRGFFLRNQLKYLSDSVRYSAKSSILRRLLQGTIDLVKNTVAYLLFTTLPKIKVLYLRFLAKRKR